MLDKNETPARGSSVERRIVIAALLVFASAAAGIFFDFEKVLIHGSSRNINSIGEISIMENDARYKPSKEVQWSQAEHKQPVHLNDAVFVGERSFAAVDLSKGGQVSIGENSMVVFSEIKNLKTADLQYGNFRLKVDGDVKVAIGGKLTAIEGAGAELQIYAPAGKTPQLKLLKGQAKLTLDSGKTLHLTDPRNFLALNVNERPQDAAELAPMPAQNLSRPSERFIRLYDEYQSIGAKLERRGQKSAHPNEVLVARKESIPSVSFVGGDKSAKVSFESPSADTQGFVTETSTDGSFPTEATSISWISGKSQTITLSKPGLYFVRVRSVNNGQELSDWSGTQQITVNADEERKVPVPVKLVQRKHKRTEKRQPAQAAEDPTDKSFEKVESPPQTEERSQPALTASVGSRDRGHSSYRRNHNLWFGLGYNYMTYDADSPAGNVSHLSYASYKGPVIHGEGKYFFSDTFQFVGGLLNSPGEAHSSSKVAVQNGDYNWMIISAEGMITPERWSFSVLNRGVRAGLRCGVQQHSIPTADVLSTTAVQMGNLNVTMATLGFQFDAVMSPSLNLEWLMRYQHPVVSSDSIRPAGPMFDGAVGLTKMLGRNWSFGAQWYGQMQNYSDSRSGSQGAQKVFFSTLEGRVGYIFP